MKKHPFLLALATASLLVACNSKNHHYSSGERANRPPAKTSSEWIESVRKDLASSPYTELTQQYAELPPEAEWSGVIDELDKLIPKLKDGDEFDQASDGYNTRSAASYQFFQAAFKGDDAAAYDHLRTIVTLNPDRNSHRTSIHQALYFYAPNKQKAVAFIQSLSQKGNSHYSNHSSSHRSSSKEAKYEELLASGKVDEGLAELKRSYKRANSAADRVERLSKIFKIAKLTDRPALVAETYEELTLLILDTAWDSSVSNYYREAWFSHAADQGDWDLVQKAAQQILKRSANDFPWQQEPRAAWLESILMIDGQEAFAKELEKLITSDGLGRGRVIGLLRSKAPSQKEVGCLYVEALIEQERTEEAWTQLRYLIALDRDNDNFYQCAVDHFSTELLPYLDKVHEFDRFEERPLIWKAQLLLDSGNPQQAKKVIDQAIALDPSDGDQGKFSRMRAYEVLSKVLDKLGDTTKAEFFAEVVLAIRDGERADDFLHAGLKSEAIKRYQESLGRFDDAYCLQSRLALTLARNGRFEEAVPHFEKAFRLMPVSFGPKESHCFGCEGLFSDKRVIPIAKKILNEFEKENPNNPRAPYLLGLVLEQLNDKEGAIAAFERAFAIDSTYINAINRLFSLTYGNIAYIPLRSELLKSYCKITPYPELQSAFQARVDLRQAWLDAETRSKSPLDLPEYPLKFGKMISNSNTTFSEDSTFDCLDGWSTEELRRRNRFLQELDSY